MGSAPSTDLPPRVELGLREIRERYLDQQRKKIRNRERGRKMWETRRQRGSTAGSAQRGEGWGGTPGKEATKLREAEDFLKRELAGGPRVAFELTHEAMREGITRSSLQAARHRLGVVTQRIPGSKRNSWRLPPRETDEER